MVNENEMDVMPLTIEISKRGSISNTAIESSLMVTKTKSLALDHFASQY